MFCITSHNYEVRTYDRYNMHTSLFIWLSVAIETKAFEFTTSMSVSNHDGVTFLCKNSSLSGVWKDFVYVHDGTDVALDAL